MIPYNLKYNDVLKELSSNFKTGLSSEESEARLNKYGKNELKETKGRSVFQKFADQFKDAMIIILMIAAFVSFIVSIYEGHTKDFFEPVLIILIVIINAAMGVIQESKAEKSLEALKNLAAPHAKVIRDGTQKIVSSGSLVPGDIIVLESGDFVPADARLISSSSLKSEESSLTGESLPSEKDAYKEIDLNAPLADRYNMVYSGCSITYGNASAVVTSTGMNTEIGKISDMITNEPNTATPLQERLSKLGKNLGFLALAACSVIFFIGILDRVPIMEIFMTSVSLAVSAIPEGLPAIITIVLSIGVQKMAKRNAIVRRLPAVESLGSASIICSDKTGTLTQNRMTLVSAYSDTSKITEDIGDKNSEEVKELLTYSALCCNAEVNFEEGEEKHIGDPTETSIIAAAYKNGIAKEKINKKYQRILELPFDSDRKLMTTVNIIGDKKIAIVKGAFDVLAQRCVNGNIDKAKEVSDSMSQKALRVIAVGYKEIQEIPDKNNYYTLEDGLTLMGLIGMIDPPRPEVREAVKICKNAGIKPVMITGDHILTASAIAKELGILKENDISITGQELSQMSDTELDKKVKNISVYARVSPEDKIRIVNAWKSQGEVVAMTGDGVNDAPALKASDIGCAMGITGTDVAKGASDIILTDDNFATIVEAIREGRGIYQNIKKVISFLLGTNIGEVIAVFLAMLFWRQTPLISVQLLWINLVTDSLPAVALGMEPIEKDIMNRNPQPKNEGIFAHGLGIKIFFQGLMFAILMLIGFTVGWNTTGLLEGGQTMAFLILSMSQVIQAFNMRSEKSIFKIGFFTNKNLNIAIVISILMIFLVLFTPLYSAFGFVILHTKLYLLSICLAFAPILIMEFAKFIKSINK